MRRETMCIQAGYEPKNGESRMIPIVQSTTFKYDTSEDMGKLFDLEASGYFYTRLQNPTNDMVAAKICALEGGSAAMLTSSGQAANFFAVFNICGAGDHVVASSTIYGGSFNLFNVTMRRMGVDFTFIDPDAPEFAVAGDICGRIRRYCEKTGQGIPESDGALVRCIYESLAMKYRYAIRQIQENVNKKFTVLHLLGGGTKDNFLCQMTADVLEFPVIAGPTEATALGNIMLQLIALQKIPDVAAGREMIRRTEKVTVYRPNPVDDLNEKCIAFCNVIQK